MTKMTSRQRVLAAMRREEVDYIPCTPTFFPLFHQQRVGHRWQLPWGFSKREEAEYLIEQLGVDPAMDIELQKYFPSPEVSSRVWFEDNKIHKVWITPSGQLHATVRYDEHWPHGFDIPFFDDFIGHFEEPWLKTESDLQCLCHILLPPQTKEQLEKVRFEITEAKAIADKLQISTYTEICHGLTGAMWLCLAEPLCIKVIDEPGLIEGFIELEHKLNMRNMEIAMEGGIDIIRRHGCYESADFFGPNMLEKFLAKSLREEVDLAHQADKLYFYRIITGVNPLLDWINTLDFDGLVDLSTFPQDVDLAKVKQKLGNKMSFWTGPSQAHHMWSDNTDVVRQAVRRTFEVLGKRGLIIKACPSVHSIQPWENTLAMIDEWKKLR